MLGAVYQVFVGEVALLHAPELVGLHLNQNGSEGLSATRIRAGNPRPSRILGMGGGGAHRNPVYIAG